MSRPTREQTLMAHAQVEAARSTCNRLQVGSLIVTRGRILGTGYNGAPSALPHCGSECYPGGPPCSNTVHAEANVIAFCARHGIATDGCVMYSTDSPCIECAKLIINAGILTVCYAREYRDTAPLELLRKVGIETKLVKTESKL